MKRRYKYYEVYCERVDSEWVSESDNFSLSLKVLAHEKKPTIDEVQKRLEYLGRLTFEDGSHYKVVGLWAEDEGGWEHTDFDEKEIILFKRA